MPFGRGSRLNKRELGASYERKAAEYLTAEGYEILERNYRCHLGEIDIIARDGEYLCFIEVKFRRNSRLGDPLEAVGIQKQKRIRLVARYYLAVHCEYSAGKCRFDAVGILPGQIRLVRNAF